MWKTKIIFLGIFIIHLLLMMGFLFLVGKAFNTPPNFKKDLIISLILASISTYDDNIFIKEILGTNIIKNKNEYSQEVKVGIIDEVYTEQTIEDYKEEIEVFNAASKDKNLATKPGYSHGNQMLEIVNRKDIVDNSNELQFTLVSTANEDGSIKKQYVNEAFNYFKDKQVDIILIAMGTDNFIDQQQETIINQLVNDGTIIVASQGAAPIETLYPAQFKNVISVSKNSSGMYNEENTKVDLLVNKELYTQSEISAYVVNILANTYSSKYRINLQDVIESEEQLSIEDAIEILSK